MNSSKTLVLGATGKTGRRIVQRLQDSGEVETDGEELKEDLAPAPWNQLDIETRQESRGADGVHDGEPSTDEATVRADRIGQGLVKTYKTVDTCAAEFEAHTPYLYSTYEDECEARHRQREQIL